ncbi:unnamed protein product, partial [Heterosigma akashiwo]
MATKVAIVKGYHLLSVPLGDKDVLHHMFIKEHRNKSDESRKTGSTLFVCNAST